MSKSKIKIYVTCFNNKIVVPNNNLFELVQGGAANAERHLPGMSHDDEGINISRLNPRFNDAATIYWAWKNFDNDYYGFFQYRRFLSFDTEMLKKNIYEYPFDTNNEEAFEKMKLLDENEMRRFIEKYDVITCNYLQYDKDYYSLYQQFCEVPYEHEKDLNLLIEIIQQKYPDFMPAVKKYLFEDGRGYFANVFIMRKKYFNQLCEWMFDILFEFDKRMDYTGYSFAERRVPGYCSERLIGIFYTYLQMKGGCKFTALQKCFFNTTREQPIDLAFPKSNQTVPIVFCTSRQYLPYCNVAVQSIIDHASADVNYDIVILHEEITSYAIKRFASAAKGKENICIRFVNVASYFYGRNLLKSEKQRKESYYLFALGNVMEKYDRVLYLDCDVVALDDIAKLFDLKAADSLLTVFRDKRNLGKRQSTAQMCESGIVLYDVKKYNATVCLDELIKLAEEHPDSPAKDILEKYVNNRVKYIELPTKKMLYESAGRGIKGDLPQVVHYFGEKKPWNRTHMDTANFFWEVAKHSSMYSDIHARMKLRQFDRYFPNNGSKNTDCFRPWELILEDTPFPDTGLSPAFNNNNNVAIELLSSSQYLPYLAVAIQSIIENGSTAKNYDFIIFTDGIPKERQKKLIEIAEPYDNVSIRFADVSQHLAFLVVAQLPQYAKLIYCRVWMAHILKNYDQIICFDSDMVVKTDISIFSNYNFNDNYVLAAHEWCYGEYGKELGLGDCTKTAINAGFMVMNLKKVREEYPLITLIQLCNARNWRYMDQDILNILFQGKIQYLDYDWNYRMDYDSVGALHITECLNNPEYKQLTPKIIHFAGEAKPWKVSGVKYEDDFWDVAERSKFYREIIIARMPVPYAVPYPVMAQPKRLLRLDHPARKYIDRFFPKGTRRREFIKKIVRFFKRT